MTVTEHSQHAALLLALTILCAACGDAPSSTPEAAPSSAQPSKPVQPSKPASAAADTPEVTAVLEVTATEGAKILPALRESLNNPELHPSIRAWAARQIGAVPGPDATKVLVAALDSDEEQIRHAAIDALVKRPGEDVQEALVGAAAHYDPYVLGKVREALP